MGRKRAFIKYYHHSSQAEFFAYFHYGEHYVIKNSSSKLGIQESFLTSRGGMAHIFVEKNKYCWRGKKNDCSFISPFLVFHSRCKISVLFVSIFEWLLKHVENILFKFKHDAGR